MTYNVPCYVSKTYKIKITYNEIYKNRSVCYYCNYTLYNDVTSFIFSENSVFNIQSVRIASKKVRMSFQVKNMAEKELIKIKTSIFQSWKILVQILHINLEVIQSNVNKAIFFYEIYEVDRDDLA